MNFKSKRKTIWRAGLTGFFTGLIGSLCCITPLFLIFLGLGSASFAFSFIGLKPYFLLVSLIFLGLSFWFHFRKKSCSVKTFVKSPFVITAFVLHLIILIGSLYFLVPALGPKVFEEKLFSENKTIDHLPSCHLSLQLSNTQFNVLSCKSCEAALKYKLENEPGIVLAEIDLTQESAIIHYISEEISLHNIIKSIPKDFTVKAIEINQC